MDASTELFDAIRRGDAAHVRALVATDRGIVNRREVARAVLEAGAPVNAGQQEGWTPLMEAVLHDDVEIAKMLLARGADPKAQNDAGKSAIGLAADRANVEMLKLLKG